MSEVMIDIETLSTMPNALVLTIGAIIFDRNDAIKELKECKQFYYKVEKSSCEKLDMHVDPETKKWWSRQSKDAQYEVFYDENNRLHLDEVLKKLSEFIKDCNYVWSNSPNFDCVILENAFRKCDIEVPWKFWQLRDTRTVYDIGNVN